VAADLFRDYYRLLAKPASRFFEKIFMEENDTSKKNETYDAMAHPYIIEADDVEKESHQ
jgi:phenylacetic acid degradation operon negative regulatory protein